MLESEKMLKKGILENYCQAKRGSILIELREKLGDDVTIKLIKDFSGRLIYIPNKSSMRRVELPTIIRVELQGVEPDSDEFKAKVKELAELYKLTQKAIKRINKKGIFTR